jgi:hypothetical protein
VIRAFLSCRSIVDIPLVVGTHKPLSLTRRYQNWHIYAKNERTWKYALRNGVPWVAGPRAQRSSELLVVLLRVAMSVIIASSAAASGSGSRWI